MTRRRYKKEKETYRIELVTNGAVSLFSNHSLGEKVIDGLRWCCDRRGLRLFEYVLLPDRLLLIANAAWGHVGDIIDSYSQFSSKAVVQVLVRRQHDATLDGFRKLLLSDTDPQTLSIWNSAAEMRSLRNREEADRAAIDLLSQPVQFGWVTKARHYRLCSAHPQNPLHEWTVSAIDPWS